MASHSAKIQSDCVVSSPAVVPLRFPVAKFLQSAQSSPSKSLASVRSTPAGQPMLIGIGGGRGAGKEFTCRYIIDKVREQGYTELAERVVHLHLDDFHRELSAEDRVQVDSEQMEINFEHPESYDFALLAQVLEGLRAGGPVDIPQWDGKRRERVGLRRVACQPRVVLVEGTLVLFVREIRELMDMQVFVDVDSDTRLGRQVRAELQSAGCEGAAMHAVLQRFLDRYLHIAKPSFEEFIWPTKRWADVIVPKGDSNSVAIELIARRLIDLDHSG
ncbi:hypothetical protein GGF46_002951 [Coemansia sp. RSA 552]|nr:hypothetical protein GGF46_002951 [Coemansia sp. RSA 552]